MSLITPTTLIAIIAAIAGIVTQLCIAFLSRRQVAKQLDLQYLISHRTTAYFIADKRQKWIDELRADMATYLALSQEILWKWNAIRDRTQLRAK